MPWARASALDRHLNCPGASWLPRAERGKWHYGYLVAPDALVRPVPDHIRDPDDDAVLAQWGTEMHKAKENAPDAADPWLDWMDPHRERLWPAGLGTHEQAWAYDCRTGLVTLHDPRRDGDADEWKAAQGPSCLTGETDWDATLPGGEPWVDDLKTGFAKPPITTPQMLAYAMVARKHRNYHGTVRISITHWRRGWEHPDRYWQQVGPVTLDSFEEEVHEAWQRAANNEDPKAGPWCRYCPSQAVCPKVTE